MDFKNTRKLISEHLKAERFDRYAISIGKKDDVLCLLSDSKSDNTTLFDMASVTKIIGVALPFILLLNKGGFSLDSTLEDFFDCPNDKKNLTILQLLTHSSGIATISFLSDITYDPDESVKVILNTPLRYKPGEMYLYSCPGYILLGKILEQLYKMPLDKILSTVTAPSFGLKNTKYKPNCNNVVLSTRNGVNPCIVNDQNARFLGGIAGNAGVYSCIEDISHLCSVLSNRAKNIISEETFCTATANYTPSLSESRGLGFVYMDEKYLQAGKLFTRGSFGHCGHTGTNMFVDINTDIHVSSLTNITRYCNNYDEVKNFRTNLHNAIYDDLIIEGVL